MVGYLTDHVGSAILTGKRKGGKITAGLLLAQWNGRISLLKWSLFEFLEHVISLPQ